ncbi:DUF2971 domain-containing protein [Roseibium sp. RKSG952]|uniref:DUF2971 domain-containing protein n=1 Tax=Roseibium sp. RKSG952 TaxID=2529384 RepID=UPI0012BCADA7|nr:DUF2971 domain-containing protein [Roseibium sp. RKSG952]MTI00513.1 DUF2971 domain-containing protein [Roseibium sp. RKSG952]
MDNSGYPPNVIYRHRGYTDRDLEDPEKRARLEDELEAAQNGCVWFSSLNSQNDPFDTLPVIVDSERAEIQRLIKAFQREYGRNAMISGRNLVDEARNLNLKIRDVRDEYSNPEQFKTGIPKHLEAAREWQTICCFTANPFSSLMWAYYSASHQSFCYEFSCEKEDLAAARKVVAKVKYLESRPTLTTVQAIRWLINSSRRANPPKHRALVVSGEEATIVNDALVLSKSKEWDRECEWRALNTQGDSAGYNSIAPYRLKSIVLGANASDRLKGFLMPRIGSDVEVRNLALSKHSYDLEFA